ERMTEYAYGAVKGREDRVGYINFLVDITPDCDCVNWSDAPIVPDIGIVASRDPVAIDRASYDLVNQERGFTNSRLENHHEVGEDKFRGVWTQVDGTIQLRYGEEIGLGEQDYELIKIP
ncbi:MAG: 4Fe-4S ferredoxin, partial [Euryarchaeota archaeon]|nr:4Fe-4S ferredoxin [Euryarchaeota archaeon]